MIIAAIFIILFCFILVAVQEMGLFGRKTAALVAICVSLLCTISLYGPLVSSHVPRGVQDRPALGLSSLPAEEAAEKEDEQNIWGLVLLLPYAVLALTLLLLPLLILLAAVTRTRCWSKIVRTCKKLDQTNRGIEPRNLETLISNQLSRRSENGKAEIKSTGKDIHM